MKTMCLPVITTMALWQLMYIYTYLLQLYLLLYYHANFQVFNIIRESLRQTK